MFISIALSFLNLHKETVRSTDDVVNHGRFLLVEPLHGGAATIVLYPLQNQTHDIDATHKKNIIRG